MAPAHDAKSQLRVAVCHEMTSLFHLPINLLKGSRNCARVLELGRALRVRFMSTAQFCAHAEPGAAVASRSSKPKVLVLTGPTGVGKSELSLLLAERLNGEVISADSVQVRSSVCAQSTSLPAGTSDISSLGAHIWSVATQHARLLGSEMQRRLLGCRYTVVWTSDRTSCR